MIETATLRNLDTGESIEVSVLDKAIVTTEQAGTIEAFLVNWAITETATTNGVNDAVKKIQFAEEKHSIDLCVLSVGAGNTITRGRAVFDAPSDAIALADLQASPDTEGRIPYIYFDGASDLSNMLKEKFGLGARTVHISFEGTQGGTTAGPYIYVRAS